VTQAKAQLIQAQAQMVNRIEARWRQRLHALQIQQDTLMQEVPTYVMPQDESRFHLNVGFVRLYNAAFRGHSPRPPAESDRTSARLSLSELTRTTVFNANVCQQWKTQALGWEAFYQQLQRGSEAWMPVQPDKAHKAK
jgi:hypothetical protein